MIQINNLLLKNFLSISITMFYVFASLSIKSGWHLLLMIAKSFYLLLIIPRIKIRGLIICFLKFLLRILTLILKLLYTKYCLAKIVLYYLVLAVMILKWRFGLFQISMNCFMSFKSIINLEFIVLTFHYWMRSLLLLAQVNNKAVWAFGRK